jgi:hypothetical protein
MRSSVRQPGRSIPGLQWNIRCPKCGDPVVPIPKPAENQTLEITCAHCKARTTTQQTQFQQSLICFDYGLSRWQYSKPALTMEDNNFSAGHGYRCMLPDLKLFVERQPETWMAIAYERIRRKNVMEQAVNDSAHGTLHCQAWVNSFRGNNSDFGLLTECLEWEIY